ncbi:MAG TPA: hypothetical protein VFY41_01645, partial [Nitrososphaeraceae archaeon]|nr:hypothetical protein [Nitrososphaeraceae archaeon]
DIIAVIIFIVVILLSSISIYYQFDEVYTLSIQSYSSSLLSLSELANINSANSSKSSYPSIENFKIYPGYKIEPVIWNLTLPCSITFDNENNMYIAEADFV